MISADLAKARWLSAIRCEDESAAVTQLDETLPRHFPYQLDETAVPGPVHEHVLHEKLPVAFLSDGPDVARHFHRPTGEHFADLLLRGRIA